MKLLDMMITIQMRNTVEKVASGKINTQYAEDARRELDIVKAMVEYGYYASVKDYEDDIFELYRKYCMTAYDSSIKRSYNISIKYKMLI